jgi:hypothetical protein
MRKLLPLSSIITIAVVGIGFFLTPLHAYAQGFNLLDFASLGIDVVYGLLGKIFWSLGIIAGWLVWLIGQMIDYATTMSLTAGFYDSPAIDAGWSVIRDLCNMIFIFVLIYTGLSTVLNIGNAVVIKKMLTSVVIAALLINFSLFITKVVIDVSNVGTAWFVQGVKNIGGGVGVSDSVRSVLQMDKLVENEDFGARAVTKESFVAGIAFLIINCVAIYVFFQVAFFLIARIVAFIFLLVTSPLGFLGGLGLKQLDSYSKKWWEELQAQALMAPMFFLMLYLTLFIVDQVDALIFGTAVSTVDPVTGSSFAPSNYVMFAIIVIMLLRCLDTAKEYSGELGGKIAGYVKSATGLALGGVTAGFGAMGRGTLGRAMVGKMESEAYTNGLKDRMAKGGVSGFAARLQLGATDKLSKSSFDARSTGILKGFDPKLSVAGIKVDGGKVGAEESKGYRGTYDATKEAEKKFAESLGKGKEGEMRRAVYAKTLEKDLVYKAKDAAAKTVGWATRVGTLGIIRGEKTGISTRDAALAVSRDLADKAPENFLKFEKEEAKKKANKKQAQLATQKGMQEYLDKAQKTGNKDEMKKAAEVAATIMAQFGKSLEKETKDDYLRFIKGYDETKVAGAQFESSAAEGKLKELKDEQARLKDTLLALETEKAKAMNNKEDVSQDTIVKIAETKTNIEANSSKLKDTEKEAGALKAVAANASNYRQAYEKAKKGKDFDKDMEDAKRKFGNLDTAVWAESAEKYATYVNTFADAIKQANDKLAEVQKMLDAKAMADKLAETTTHIKARIIGNPPPPQAKGKKKLQVDPKTGELSKESVGDASGLHLEALKAKFKAQQKLDENKELREAGDGRGGGEGGGGEAKKS